MIFRLELINKIVKNIQNVKMYIGKKPMRFLESIVNVSYGLYSAVMMVIGLGIIILALVNPPLQLQIALGFLGLGFITLGLVQVKRGQDRKTDVERFDLIMAKLDEMQQELQKEDQPKGTGVVIADVLSSGLKYYSDYLVKQKEEKDS